MRKILKFILWAVVLSIIALLAAFAYLWMKADDASDHVSRNTARNLCSDNYTFGGAGFTVCKINIDKYNLSLEYSPLEAEPFDNFESLEKTLGDNAKNILFAISLDHPKSKKLEDLSDAEREFQHPDYPNIESGIFGLTQGKAHIGLTSDSIDKLGPETDNANTILLQSAPLISYNYRTALKLKQSGPLKKRRSGICMHQNNKDLVLVTSHRDVWMDVFTGFFNVLKCKSVFYLGEGNVATWHGPSGKMDKISKPSPILLVSEIPDARQLP